MASKGEGVDWKSGSSRCKLVYIGQINNEVLLYNTENHIKYPMISHNKKIKMIKYTYMYN